MSAKTDVYVRVTMRDDGQTPKYELMLNGAKICDMTYHEIVDMVMQAASSLRWQVPIKLEDVR